MSYGLITITGQLCDFLGLRFGLLALLVTTATATGVLIGGRRLTAHRRSATNTSAGDDVGGSPRQRRANDLWITGGILLGATIGAATVLTAMGSLEAVT